MFPKEISVLELEKLPARELLLRLPKPKESTSDTTALFAYQNRHTKVLVDEIKHHENKVLVEKVAGLMCEKILESFEEDLQFGTYKISLVSVPSSAGRVNERGYNPAELIARKIVELRPDIFEFASILRKVRETKRQTNLPRAERLTNLVGAFEATTSNAPVIIIDDVSTTGATIAEARRALSAKNIFVRGAFVIAK